MATIIKKRSEAWYTSHPNPKSSPKEIAGHHGHRPAGPSILWPALYRHLRAKGMTKAKAAAISNAQWNKKHGMGAKNVVHTRIQKAIKGDGDGDGIPYEKRKRKAGLSQMVRDHAHGHKDPATRTGCPICAVERTQNDYRHLPAERPAFKFGRPGERPASPWRTKMSDGGTLMPDHDGQGITRGERMSMLARQKAGEPAKKPTQAKLDEQLAMAQTYTSDWVDQLELATYAMAKNMTVDYLMSLARGRGMRGFDMAKIKRAAIEKSAPYPDMVTNPSPGGPMDLPGCKKCPRCKKSKKDCKCKTVTKLSGEFTFGAMFNV